MGKMRFGIIGCGNIAHTHALAIEHMEDAILLAAASRSEEKAKSFAEEHHCEYFSDYKKMLERPDIDIVTICTPSGMHASMAVDAAKAGKHVIVEKPMDVSLDKADKMIEIFKKTGLKLSVVFQRRFEDDIIKVKEIIDKGKLGNLYFAGCHVKWYRSQEYYDSGAWRGTWAQDGGGVLMNQSIHYIDLLQYLAGPVQEVYARCCTLGHERIEVEDEAVATVKFDNGALGVIEATTNAYPGLMSKIDIYGSEGTIVIENDRLINLFLKNGEEIKMSESKQSSAANSPTVSFESHKRQFEAVVKAIKNGEEPPVNGMEGRKSLEIILAIYKSNSINRPVRLPFVPF